MGREDDRHSWGAITGIDPLYGSLCSSCKLASSPFPPTGFQLMQREPYRGSVPVIAPPPHQSPSLCTIHFPLLPKFPLLPASLLSFSPVAASTQ
ncbi:unnamed protein product [Staurois parvus]|uniref:Uncharacterized protein n=1 Tax=Staurois parvus TaxID=386267 RepID=A0ABN9GQF5_9NEOB|nr:unnamed protein product [Staurois parvus]